MNTQITNIEHQKDTTCATLYDNTPFPLITMLHMLTQIQIQNYSDTAKQRI